MSQGWCMDCGDRTGSNTAKRCQDCHTVWTTYWTRARVVRALRLWVLEHGTLPTQTEWRASSPEYPNWGTVRDRFGSWNEGIRAAGFKPRIARRWGEKAA